MQVQVIISIRVDDSLLTVHHIHRIQCSCFEPGHMTRQKGRGEEYEGGAIWSSTYKHQCRMPEKIQAWVGYCCTDGIIYITCYNLVQVL